MILRAERSMSSRSGASLSLKTVKLAYSRAEGILIPNKSRPAKRRRRPRMNWHNPVGCDNRVHSPVDFAERLRRHAAPLEHDPEKRKPVFHATNAMRLRADHAQTRDQIMMRFHLIASCARRLENLRYAGAG